MTIRSPLRARLLAPLACMLAAVACSSGDGPVPDLTGSDDPSGTLFFEQVADPNGWMDALYQGKIIRDEQGCLRLETWAPHPTVIWPRGYSVESRADGLHVLDRAGRSEGRVGGAFRLGGGEVPSLAGAHLSDEDIALAQSRCPGTYFIAQPSEF